MLLLEQLLNGLQLGVFLFLLASGLTLIFGIMGIVNLAHGSFYMLGAYGAAVIFSLTGSFLLALIGGVLSVALIGFLVEKYLISLLYGRDHLEQVLISIGLIFIADESVGLLFGKSPQFLPVPQWLDSTTEIFPGFEYSSYRLFIIAIGLFVFIGLKGLINHTKLGMKIRAGESDRLTITALGVNINRIYAIVFTLGAVLAALSGIFAAPLLSVEIGMGNDIIILVFVCIIIGGLGSVTGAFVGAMIIGVGDTLGRVFLPDFFHLFLPTDSAAAAASAFSSMLAFLIMIGILLFKPNGLFAKS